MDDYNDIIKKINIPSTALKGDSLQELLSKAQKWRQINILTPDQLRSILEIIWNHLENGLDVIDDQLLTSICFFTILPLCDTLECFLTKTLDTINIEGNMHLKISLMYGILQSSFLKEVKKTDMIIVPKILLNTLHSLIAMAYTYSSYTFLSFKVLTSFKKIIGTELQSLIFSCENQSLLLNLVNHNWENPITGVRDLNRNLFQIVLSVLNDSDHYEILTEVNGFYWNKAKFLMLSEFVHRENKNIIELVKNYDWIEGVVLSLYKSGLVSAGADMYYTILNKIKSITDWTEVFLPHIKKVFKSLSVKAIENFTNYWCITTFKKFPELVPMLLNDLKILESENDLYISLSIKKQANKLGLIDKSHISKDILEGLVICKDKIRMLAFDIVCVSQSQSMPSESEYELVYTFLINNVNTDSTVLRISMINNLKIFLIRSHMAFLNTKRRDEIVPKELLEFIRNVQSFLQTGITVEGNYQRKITTIKILEALFTCVSEVPRKKQQQTRSRISLLDTLKTNNEWNLSNNECLQQLITLMNDPSDDIRENVGNIIFNFYNEQLKNKNIFNVLLNNTLKSIQSKYFYEISCGQSMANLIAKFLINHGINESEIITLEELYDFGLKEIVTEVKNKENIIQSIENGKQIHAYLSFLHSLISNSVLFSYKLKNIQNSIWELLDCLGDISNQFAWEEQASTSSDFSKMNDVVQEMISNAGHSSSNDNDMVKISGMHQIVLNCLWLNVKTSCELSALLIKYFDSDVDICSKCLDIITNVLETSRHKGAIEAAGAALGQSINHLTSKSKETALSNLPHKLLERKLNELIWETGQTASVTRRGAGLSIMVHRIVSNDTQKGKPLFNYFMTVLLKDCITKEDIPSNERNKEIDNEKDIPKAIYIHFLTRIVTDSSLASDVMFYSAKLGEIAFTNLTSNYWQIRNAALQLYGALVPKLIGQKKLSALDTETTANVACDELRTHSPELWQYITTQLQCNNQDTVLYHSHLVPILNMLANCAVRYNFKKDVEKQSKMDQKMYDSFQQLLGSPIYTVRRLTAMCIYNISSFEIIFELLHRCKLNMNENYLHGVLLVTKLLYNRYYIVNEFVDQFSKIKMLLNGLLKERKFSYLSWAIYEDMFFEYNSIEYLVKAFSDLRTNKHVAGVNVWINILVQKYVQRTEWQNTEEILKLILQQNDYELYLESVNERLKMCEDIHTINTISILLLEFNKKFESTLVWQILYEITSKSNVTLKNEHWADIIKYFQLNNNNIPYKTRYLIPFVVSQLILKENGTMIELLETVSSIIFKLTNPECADNDMRYIAALACNEFNNISEYKNTVKANIIKSMIMLLQDEDEDIRNDCVNLYGKVAGTKYTPHPYICLSSILTTKFLINLCGFSKIEVNKLCQDVLQILKDCEKSSKQDTYNPFANDSKNIYIEVKYLENKIQKLILFLNKNI